MIKMAQLHALLLRQATFDPAGVNSPVVKKLKIPRFGRSIHVGLLRIGHCHGDEREVFKIAVCSQRRQNLL